MVSDRNRRGQSVVEYLVIAAAVIAAVIVFGTGFRTQVDKIGKESSEEVGEAATKINDIAIEKQ